MTQQTTPNGRGDSMRHPKGIKRILLLMAAFVIWFRAEGPAQPATKLTTRTSPGAREAVLLEQVAAREAVIAL